MYINLPKINFDIFNYLRIFPIYHDKDEKVNIVTNDSILISKLLHKLNLIKHNYKIYELFYLKEYIKSIITKYNTYSYLLMDEKSQNLYYYYCECFQHPIFTNLFLPKKQYNILTISNSLTTIPYYNILNILYPSTDFTDHSYENFPIDFKEINTIDYFLKYCNNYYCNYNFIVLDLDFRKKDNILQNEELILVYFSYIINILATNGSCIIKMEFSQFADYNTTTFELLSLIISSFQHVSMFTPICCKSFDPSYYLLCRNFQKTFYKSKYINLSLSLFQNIIFKNKNQKILSFLNFTIPLYYKNKLNDLIMQFIYELVETLQQIYNYHINFDQNKIDMQHKKRIYRAKQWINNYSIIHKYTINTIQNEEVMQVLNDIINVIELCNEF